MSKLSGEILTAKRKYYTDKVKSPLMEQIVALKEISYNVVAVKEIAILCNLYPEPTKENTTELGTHILIDTREYFFEHRDELGIPFIFLSPSFRLLIVEFEHDPYYRHRFEWFIEYTIELGWDSSLPFEHNLNILIIARDKFFGYEKNKGRDPLFRSAFRLLIDGYKKNPDIRCCVNLFIEQIKERGWPERLRTRPSRDSTTWREP